MSGYLEATRSEYIKRRYGGSQSLLNRREQALVDALLREIPERPARVLDLPCGHGRFTPQLRALATTQLVCADRSQRRLDALREAEPSEGTPIEMVAADIFQGIPLPDRAFDLVFSFRFFHHVKDAERREQATGELTRLAGTHLLISYYGNSPLHALQKRFWKRKGHMKRLHVTPTAEAHELFRRHGWNVIADRAVMPGVHAHRVALLRRSA